MKLYESTMADLERQKLGFLYVSLYASSIGKLNGKKAMIDHSSCVKHYSKRFFFYAFLVLDTRRQVRTKYRGS